MATKTATVARPADAPADATGRLVDAESGAVLVYWHGGHEGDWAKDLRGWTLRWATGYRRRTGGSLRYERFADEA